MDYKKLINGLVLLVIILLLLSLLFKLLSFLFPIIVIILLIILIDKYFFKKNSNKMKLKSNITVKTITRDLPISLDEAFELFNPLMTKQGQEISTKDLKLQKENNKYSIIIDNYKAKAVVEKETVTKLDCTCTYKGYCKHEYALIKLIKKNKV